MLIRDIQKSPEKYRRLSMEPTHPDKLVENVTAPSAGGFPGPDGEVGLRMRLFFRTTSGEGMKESVLEVWNTHQLQGLTYSGASSELDKEYGREAGAVAQLVLGVALISNVSSPPCISSAWLSQARSSWV